MPLTAATNCAFPPVTTALVAGLTLTLTIGAVMVTLALAVLPESAALVATTVAEPAADGAV